MKHGPVRWMDWGPEAFAKARSEDRPILLDVGAVWCHWCHVMDRESYQDPSLAELLNAEWVCIKVDRDERPDVDARYQRAVQAMTQQGGWPLTAFLTHDGSVFFGGTYFPPDGTHGRPGFRTMLVELRRLWREERDKLTQQADLIRARLADVGEDTVTAGAVTPDLLAQAAESMVRVFDFHYGGFGTSPKFPHPGALRFLLTRHRDLVDRTLTAMANGGIYDHVGGGFHRYSVDARWHVPHFEKMLYDNAELLGIYADAGSAYQTVTADIARWAMELMADPAGGYAGSQDADVGLDDDGDYFTWTREEVRNVCDPDAADAVIRYYGITDERSVLHVVDPTADPALVATGRAALRTTRAERKAPYVDRTIYVGWSALMASALLRTTHHAPRTHEHALHTAHRLFTEGADGSGGLRHALGSPVRGLLEDQVYAAQLALDAWEHTGDRAWLDRGADLMDHVLAHYLTPAGTLRDRAGTDGDGMLSDPVIPIHDAPAPSPNGVAADVLVRLAEHTGVVEYRAAAQRLLEALGETLGDLGVHGASLLLAADRLLQPATHVVVVAEDDEAGRALAYAARTTWAPRRVLTLLRPGADPARLPEPVRAMLTAAHPRAYVCIGAACRAPVATPDDLREALTA
ncbi:MAG: thioredoxin domain-containing protein [Gemmatimonadales bacterium]